MFLGRFDFGQKEANHEFLMDGLKENNFLYF
jgi:hypothetical protein